MSKLKRLRNSIATSKRTSIAIQEEIGKEESSDEQQNSVNTKLKNYKNYKQEVNLARNSGLDLADYLPKTNVSDNVPNTNENVRRYMNTVHRNRTYNNDGLDLNFTEEKPHTAISPGTQRFINNFNDRYGSTIDQNSSVKLDNLQGDLDTLSKILNTTKVTVFGLRINYRTTTNQEVLAHLRK